VVITIGPNELLDKGFRADTAIPRFHAVVLTDIEHCAVVDTAGVAVLGFCQEEVTEDDSDRGRVANIRMEGITRAIAGAALTLFQRVQVAADGRVIPHDTGSVVGRVMTPVTQANDHIDLWLTSR
jgi:hypothetical protein